MKKYFVIFLLMLITSPVYAVCAVEAGMCKAGVRGFESLNERLLPDNLEQFFEKPVDYIIDAIDTVSTKIALAELAWRRNISIISSMGTGNKLHPELFEIADIYETSVCPLCRVMRRELKARGIFHLKVLYSREQPLKVAGDRAEEEGTRRSVPGSISFVPPVAGLLIAGEVVRDLIGG